jgi:hypothetical protein
MTTAKYGGMIRRKRYIKVLEVGWALLGVQQNTGDQKSG